MADVKMTPELLTEYLAAARQGGALSVELEAPGVRLRFTLGGEERVARRAGPREVESRLGSDVDPDILYGSAG